MTTSEIVARVLDEAIRDGRASGSPGIGMSRADIQRYSISRVIRAMDRRETLKDGIEFEMHQELSRGNKMASHVIEGFGIPFDVFSPTRATRDLSAGAFSQGGALVATDVGSTAIPLLRNKVSAIRLGATVLEGLTSNLALPRQTSPSTAQAVSESGPVTKSTPTVDQVSLTPHRTGVVVEYSRQLVLQSSLSVENFLRQDLMNQLGIKLDYYILNGQGASSEPLGILNTPGIGSTTFGGTATWQSVLSFENALATANADVPGARMAIVTTPGVRNKWKSVAVALTGATTVSAKALWEAGTFDDGSGDGVVNSYRAAVTNQVLNNGVLFGNWQEVILGLFGSGIDLLVNPSSRDTEGMIRISANCFADVALRHPQSFCVSSDAGNQ